MGLPLMNTFEEPVTMPALQPVFWPITAAGRPLMNTFGDPSTTGAPLLVASPCRAADVSPVRTSELPPTTASSAKARAAGTITNAAAQARQIRIGRHISAAF